MVLLLSPRVFLRVLWISSLLPRDGGLKECPLLDFHNYYPIIIIIIIIIFYFYYYYYYYCCYEYYLGGQIGQLTLRGSEIYGD